MRAHALYRAADLGFDTRVDWGYSPLDGNPVYGVNLSKDKPVLGGQAIHNRSYIILRPQVPDRLLAALDALDAAIADRKGQPALFFMPAMKPAEKPKLARRKWQFEPAPHHQLELAGADGKPLLCDDVEPGNRNTALFDDLRQWAYAARQGEYRKASARVWRDAVFTKAYELRALIKHKGASFSIEPYTLTETEATAKSVSDWVFSRYSPYARGDGGEYTQEQRSNGGKKRALLARARNFSRDRYIVQLAQCGYRQKDIALLAKVSQSTISRVLTSGRAEEVILVDAMYAVGRAVGAVKRGSRIAAPQAGSVSEYERPPSKQTNGASTAANQSVATANQTSQDPNVSRILNSQARADFGVSCPPPDIANAYQRNANYCEGENPPNPRPPPR